MFVIKHLMSFFPLFLGQYETKSKLENFSGSGSISSADLFGDDSSKSQNYGGSDYSAIRDGMREGVSAVAGKVSGIMSSIQVRCLS